MKKLLGLSDLSRRDVHDIWDLVVRPPVQLSGTVAWSFEGDGIRTRTTFIEAFRQLGLAFTELPNLLKTGERVRDLAGYLDPLFEMYVIRESNHLRLAEFAGATCRPVINAMSSEAHPCEVLTDAYFVHSRLVPLERARICLWGPPTNVLRSWHELARVLGLNVMHVCSAEFHESAGGVLFTEEPPLHADVVITDAWPTDAQGQGWSLTERHLAKMGWPTLLPTPPFTIGRELSVDPLTYSGFAGYHQKELLVPVQMAILRYVAAA
jgi:ornithine carbamoyltransferase